MNDNVKPAVVEPPINPLTGKCTPHQIQYRATDILSFGQLFIAAVEHSQSAKEITQWELDNALALTDLAKQSVAANNRLQARITAARAKFETPEPANGFLSQITAQFELCRTHKALTTVWNTNQAAINELAKPDYDLLTQAYEHSLERVAGKTMETK